MTTDRRLSATSTNGNSKLQLQRMTWNAKIPSLRLIFCKSCENHQTEIFHFCKNKRIRNIKSNNDINSNRRMDTSTVISFWRMREFVANFFAHFLFTLILLWWNIQCSYETSLCQNSFLLAVQGMKDDSCFVSWHKGTLASSNDWIDFRHSSFILNS